MSFESALEFTLRWEGGYSNDPSDPGGETKYGISKRYHPNVDVKNLTIDEAQEIYRMEYWNPSGCDSLPEPLDLIVFDTAVNMGIKRARSFLSETSDWRDYLFLRLSYYLGRRKQYPQFIFGWLNRLLDLWETARKGT